MEITKAKLINLLYDYARIHKCPSARITFQGKSVTLYLGKRMPALQDLTMEDAYSTLEKYVTEKQVSRGNGYIGRSMSMNAKRAYERGLKPLSRFTSADLKQHGFHYPVRFFRWLVYNWISNRRKCTIHRLPAISRHFMMVLSFATLPDAAI